MKTAGRASLPPRAAPPRAASAGGSDSAVADALAAAADAPSRPATPPAASTDASSGSEAESADAADADVESVSRPSLYPAGKHAPVPRAAPLEEYYDLAHSGQRHIELLDELKTSRMEGWYNLSFLLLCFSLFYLAVRNVLEKGVRVGLSNLCPHQIVRDVALCVAYGTAAVAVFGTISFTLVYLQTHTRFPQSLGLTLHMLSMTCALTITSLFIVRSPINPLSGGVLASVVVVVVLKSHSFVITNALLAEELEQKRRERQARRNAVAAASTRSGSPAVGAVAYSSATRPLGEARARSHNHSASSGSLVVSSTAQVVPPARQLHKVGATASTKDHSSATSDAPQVVFPKNVTVSNFAYFLAAPVLVYELNYPRVARVRLDYIVWHSGQIVLCLLIQYVLLMQFCVPVFQSMSSDALGETVILILRIAIPAFSIFLLMFWGLFHCLLNVIAECLRFADRGFYSDWWNATTISSFWRKWNIPVHEWCLRHVYVEFNSRHNVRASTAGIGTFLVSAILHEYVLATAFKLTPFSGAGWMFVGMCLQPTFMLLDPYLKETRNGNLLMWANLFLGQPLITITYVRGFLRERGVLMCP